MGSLFDKLFIETNSYSSRTAALIMYIKGRVFVEFSDVGSLYIYKRDNPTIAFLSKGPKNINSVNDLKNTSYGNLIGDGWYIPSFKDEGFIRHSGYWQYRLDRWMKYKIVNEPSPQNEKEDEVFTSVDLPSQSTRLDFKKPSVRKPDDSIVTKTAYFMRYVETDISSKEIFLSRCRIVANSYGFYLAEKTESNPHLQRYLHLCPLVQFSGKPVTGSIWIKRPDGDDWRAIIHAFDGKEVLIGFIKEDIEGYAFKQNNSSMILHFKKHD